MANKHTTLNNLFTEMANALREKKRDTASIIADNFPTEIENLRTGFDYNNSQVTSIPDYAFYGCEDLNSVDCCNLTSIGTGAFENCTNLKSVTLYEGVTSVGENTFKGCDCTIYCKLESQPETWHENWNPDGCEVVWTLVETWDISATEEDNVTAKLYNDVSNEGKYALVIDGTGDMKNYTSSGVPWYSYRDSLINTIIGSGVTSIGNYAFYYCSSLMRISIPDSVTSIGKSAFISCSSLTSMVIPDKVTSIGVQAFDSCKSLTGVVIPDSVTSIGYGAFRRCSSLTSVIIPDSVISIGENAFENTAYYNNKSNWVDCVLYIGNHLIKTNDILGDCVIREGTVAISNGAFHSCSSLTSITIPDSVTTIGDNAFFGCSSLTDVVIGGSVTSIGSQAFYQCSSLTSVIIPDSVTSIGHGAFYSCDSLTSAVIGDGVTSIGGRAFYSCSNLTNIEFEGTTAQWNTITKGDTWNENVPATYVQCSDGQVAL